jgi:hypothetical protein
MQAQLDANAKRPVLAPELSRSIPEMIQKGLMVCWHRTTRYILTALILLSVGGCIPITLKTEKVEPKVSVTDAAPDWNADVGPDVRLKFVSDVRRAILAKRKDVEFVEPDALWAESFHGAQPGSLHKSVELVSSLKSGAAAHLGLRYLIVLGPTVSLKHDSSNDIPFYSAGLQRTSLQAVVLRWGTVDTKARLVQSAAQGIEREGWIPGTPLIFTRLYKEVDTDGGALRGLVSALLDEISADTGDGPIRVVILAEVQEQSARKKS